MGQSITVMEKNDLEYMFNALVGSKPLISGSGGWMMVHCLFGANHARGDKARSAAVSIDDNYASYYTCHGCGKRGMLMDMVSEFVKEYHPRSAEHKRLLKQFIGREGEKNTNWTKQDAKVIKRKAKYFDYTEESKTLSAVGDYWRRVLASKGITKDETIDKFYKQYQDDLIIPFYNAKGKCIGAKRRWKVIPEGARKYVYHYQLPTFDLFYPEWIYPSGTPLDTVIIVEGEHDAHHFQEMGFNCLATLGTSNFDVTKRDRLYRRYDPFNLIIANDPDKAGVAGAKRIAAMTKDECFVTILKLKKDPRSITQKEMLNVYKKLKERP